MSTDFKEYKAAFLEQNDLAHFGILGMKWGVRRYQNPDGTLTPAGKKRYDRLEDASDFNFRMSIGSSPRKAKKYFDKSMALNEKAKKYGTETPEERAEKQRAKERWESIPKKDRDRLEKIGNNFKDDKIKAKFKRAMQEDIYSLSFFGGCTKCFFL